MDERKRRNRGRVPLMELMMIVRVLLRRWYMIAIPLVGVSLVAIPALLTPAPAQVGGYTTTIRYTAAQPLEAIPNRDGDFQDVWLASELAVNAFTEWIRSRSFTAEVRRLLPPQLAGDLPDGLFATDNARSIGVISLTWRDADELAQIADAVETVLLTRTVDYFPQLGGSSAQVRVLDDPQIVPAPPPITSRLLPLLQVGVALVVGVALAFLTEYLDPFIHRREQVERLDMPVLASIPRERRR